MTITYRSSSGVRCSACGMHGFRLNQFGSCVGCWTKLTDEQRAAAGAVKVVERHTHVHTPHPRARQMLAAGFIGGVLGAAAMNIFWFLLMGR